MTIVYVLRSLRNGKRYIGTTFDLKRRLAEHARGVSRFTSQNLPGELIYQESYEAKGAAAQREKFLKSGQGRKFLDSIQNGRSEKNQSHRSGIV